MAKKNHGKMMLFAIYCINNNIPLDKLTDEEYDIEFEKFNKILQELIKPIVTNCNKY